MKKTLIVSGALAIILSLTPNLQAGTWSQGYQIHVYLPPTIGVVLNEDTDEVEQVLNRGVAYDVTVQNVVLDGQMTTVKTHVLL